MFVKFNSKIGLYVALVFATLMFLYGLFLSPLYSLVTFCTFLLLHIAIFFYFKKDKLHPVLIISTIYFLSSIFSLFVDLNWLAQHGYKDHYSLYFLFSYVLLIFIVISPGFVLNRASIDWSVRNSFLDFIVKWAWPFLLFTVVYLSPFALKSLFTGAELVRSTVVHEEGVLPVSPLTTVAVGVAQFFSLFIILWFYAEIKRYSKFIKYSMLLGPVAGILWGFVFASRDVLIWVPLTFVLGYWYWYDYLDNEFKKSFKKILLVVLFLSGSFFSLFTYQRFSTAQEGIIGSLVGYFGYQPYVFAEMINSHNNFYGLSLRFPFFAKILGEYENIFRYQPYEWQFGTMLADFYGVSGWFSLFLIPFIIAFFYFIAFKKDFLTNPECRLVLMVLYFNIMTQGVFYFRLGSTSGNQYIVLMLMLAFLLNMRRRKWRK